MKLKITEPGWEGYTGPAGGVHFENGVSVEDVSERDAHFIGNTIRAHWEDGTIASTSQLLIDTNARSVDEMTAEQARIAAEAAEAEKPVRISYTREQLEQIAEEQGIQGLRVIADDLGIRSNSMAKLIDALAEHFAPRVEGPVLAPAPNDVLTPEEPSREEGTQEDGDTGAED